MSVELGCPHYLLARARISLHVLGVTMTGDELLGVLGTLANPHRMRVIASLARERNYVSRLARELGISRALLQVHLRKLEAAGLVKGRLELTEDGKAKKFYEVRDFAFDLTPAGIADAVRTLSTQGEQGGLE
jgi:DNA-binding transcriptional ArsR family regulator